MSLLPVSASALPRAAHARPPAAADSEPSRLITAATALLPLLVRGERIATARLRRVMEEAFGGSDAEGRWSWKLAYEACEAAQVLFLRRYGAALLRRPGGAQALLAASNAWPTCFRPRPGDRKTDRPFSSSPRPCRWG